jgi:hypothetical protein
MRKLSSKPRTSAVAISEELRTLIRETYSDTDRRFAILTMITIHLDHLNNLGAYADAIEFLRQEEENVRADAKRLRDEKRKARFRLVAQITGPTIVVLLAKFFAAKYGLFL